MIPPEQLGFEQPDPITLKGFVHDWENEGHHLTLLREGYVPYHWRDTRSFDPREYQPREGEAPRKMNNAKGTMNRLSELSLAGGEAAIRADGHDDIFVGTVTPGCLWVGDVSFGEKSMTMKGFRFHRFAEVGPEESELASEVRDSVKRFPHGTLGNAKQERERIRDLVRQLEGSGRL